MKNYTYSYDDIDFNTQKIAVITGTKVNHSKKYQLTKSGTSFFTSTLLILISLLLIEVGSMNKVNIAFFEIIFHLFILVAITILLMLNAYILVSYKQRKKE